MLGYGGECGIIVCSGPYSSVIRIFTIEEDITLMNDYIENLNIKKDYNSFRIGDLVVIKSKLSRFLTIKGVGIILEKTTITTTNFQGDPGEEKIHAYVIFFPEEGCDYTIPVGCIEVFCSNKVT